MKGNEPHRDNNGDVLEFNYPLDVRGCYRVEHLHHCSCHSDQLQSGQPRSDVVHPQERFISVNCPWCRSRLGVVELYGQHLPEKKEKPIKDKDGKTIVTFYLGGVILAGEHLDERKRPWENTYPREAKVRRTKAQRLSTYPDQEKRRPRSETKVLLSRRCERPAFQ